jgi:hypothetical protein
MDGGAAGGLLQTQLCDAVEDSAGAWVCSVGVDGFSVAYAEYSFAAGWVQSEGIDLGGWEEEAGFLLAAEGL